ncbi:unnamed protein product [Rotaria sp. Silwood2]|nr:unnamed protein product [Rotaria sp. Silwood2]CAF2490869.1 unnamed protein product [Rotaria sp. Silwood2]CAF2721068.1 unnamed protein product [Rotaria sp. Silwood2]CAF2890980.1 unnamed protein product [Rotaria sp. Silwood2]CAF3913498.1 unnamed protein product [Rotaria sp. Silwood2]
MSYLRRKPEDEIWYIHSPLKKGNRELVTAPPPSQIPYLNGVFDDEATINQPKPIYVRETDSDYIRRCKLGGSSNLLVHIDPATRKSKEPVPYPRPLWWDAMCEPIPSPVNLNDNEQQGNKPKTEHVFGAPEWFVHSEHNHSSDKQQNAPSRQNNTSRQAQLLTNTKRK